MAMRPSCGALRRVLNPRSTRPSAPLADDMDILRRRALYRAAHRGTKEMDWLIGRFAHARVADMDTAGLALFERLLETPDPDLERWIMGSQALDNEAFAGLVAALRRFHGLPDLPDL